jgi:membrane protein
MTETNTPAHSEPAGHPEEAPDKPAELGGGGWMAALRRVPKEYSDDNLSDWAASLTYRAIQSIFPGLLVLVSLLGLLGKSATQPVITQLGEAAPANVRQILLPALQHLQQAHAAAGILAVVAVLGGLWSASGYIGAFIRAANAVYDVPEGRPFWKIIPLRIAMTIVILVLLLASVLIVVVTGDLASRLGSALGVGSIAVTAWDIAKWPVLLIIVSFMFALLYWAAPNARRSFRWVSAGGVLAVILWLAASGLFAVYVANFGHYNKVYGSLGGVIVFLVWMWISNVALLVGAEFNAELERGRAMAGGFPSGKEPYEELRDDRKLRKNSKRGRRGK